MDALWTLVWRGLVTNDTFHALRVFTAVRAPRRRPKRVEASAFRSRRLVPPAAEGRWALVRALPGPPRVAGPHHVRPATTTGWAAALAQQLLARHGVLTREAVAAESLPGGFGIVYPVLKAMEEAGRLRRGYFVAGLGATQFALPGALDLLRSFRSGAPDADGQEREILALAATDPANPYGATLPWPASAAAVAAASARQGPQQNAVAAASARQAPQQTRSPPLRRASPPAQPALRVPSPAHGKADGDGFAAARRPTRSVGATVFLVEGALAAHLARGDRMLLTWLPDAEPLRSKSARAVARMLIERARTGGELPARHADRRDRRCRTRRTSDGAISRRGGISPRRHGISSDLHARRRSITRGLASMKPQCPIRGSPSLD